MTRRYYPYLSPKIVPAFPAETGTLDCVIDFNHILRTRAYRRVSGSAMMEVAVYGDGRVLDTERFEAEVRDGRALLEPVIRHYAASGSGYGYAEFSFRMSEPVFLKILPEPGYAVLKTPAGSITINADMKYANPRTIEQIMHYGKFSMIHSGVHVDPDSDSGNSLLLINPYDQPLLARLVSDTGETLSHRMKARTAGLVDLEPLVTPGRPGAIIVTANNRVITYDVKHARSNPARINSIDHLDPFSGYRTHEPQGLPGTLGYWAREAARGLGIRYD